MKKFIFILMVGSLLSTEESYAELLAADIKMNPINIELKIVMDENKIPTEDIVIYFSGGLYKFAIYLDKIQRQKMVELYNKYEKWKKVALENKVSHVKELGKINKVRAYLYLSEWYKANTVSVRILASVGTLNNVTLAFPKFQSVYNEYIDANPPPLLFMDKSVMNTSWNDAIEITGLTSPTEFIINNLEETKLLEIRKKILEKRVKVKNVDSLFE